MKVLSNEFLDAMMGDVTDKVDQSLQRIEKHYAVRSRHLKKKNACIYADISGQTLEKWLAKGLPVSKIDGCFRIDTKDIDEFIERHRI